jgi:hypothetical protein
MWVLVRAGRCCTFYELHSPVVSKANAYGALLHTKGMAYWKCVQSCVVQTGADGDDCS